MKNRKLKIQRVGDPWRGTEQPQIRLQGRWLREAGFEPDSRVDVEVREGRLIIRRWQR